MSTELYTPRSYPISASPRDFGSTYSCSSSEASSRLAARLERSEYKRSRGKQRLKNNYNSPRNHSRRRENRGSKRKNNQQSFLATRETRTKSEEDGVTSVWEVYRQNPLQFNEEKTYTLDQPRSWYDVPNQTQDHQKRPRSMHSTVTPDVDRNFTDLLSSRSPRRQEPRNSNCSGYSKAPVYSKDFQPKRINTAHEINGDGLYHGDEVMNYETNQCHTGHNRNLDKKGAYLSRSLSSSYSSNVGSSDEREDSKGIYSAYDMAGRSPYDSMLNRRYSQSSLSSSNASWHHSGSSFNYNVKDIPPLLDPIDKPRESPMLESSSGQIVQEHPQEEFRLVKETRTKIPPPVAPKPTKYSSSYTIQLHSSSPANWKESYIHDTKLDNNESSIVQSYPLQAHKLLSSPPTPKNMEGSNNLMSVRDMARKFTPTSVRHISSETHSRTVSGEDTRRVKAEHWPKVVSIMHQESFPSSNIKDTPTTRTSYKGVIMRNKEETHKNNEELASHRLSLQELIKLHEEQIAIQAKSAKQTVLTANVYVKHTPSDASPRQSKTPEYNYFELKDVKTELSQEPSLVNTKHESSQNQQKEDTMATTKPNVRHSGYEVREVKTDQSSPFKVIELTGKSFENLSNGGTRERSARVKRHRTIGIVGYRQQIDRTAEEKAPAKQKRHTTAGIVYDFKEITTEKFADASSGAAINDAEIRRSTLNDYESQKETTELRHQEERRQQEDQTNSIPVKVFDIEKGQEPQNLAHIEKTVGSYEEPPQVDLSDGEPKEPPITTSSANYWYSSYPQKDFSDMEKYVPSISVSPDNYKEDTLPRGVDKEPQQYSLLSTSGGYAKTPQDAKSRNLHSPVVELLPSRKGHPTAYYKAAIQVVSHSSPSDHKERGSSASHTHSEQKLPLVTSTDDIFHQTKPYSVPVAQVSPVNQNETIQAKAVDLSSSPPDPPSAHEMYQTRLAMWDLLPHQDRSTGDLTDHQSNEGVFSFGDKSKQSLSSKDISRSPHYQNSPKDYEAFTDKGNRFTGYASQSQKDEHYERIIEKLKEENQRLKEKNEAEKQEFRRMYEEQKKVANAYQKLEDRYRRRVHELQDALANCTCQGCIIAKDRKNPHVNKSDKESQSSKTQSINSGMRIFEELEEWLSEQSKNTKASKVNATSRDSLISSSSDLTGWDDHIDGAIDQVNGTHV